MLVYVQMNTIQKRFLLFLIGCIGSRSLFAYIAKHASKTQLVYLGTLALLPAIGFLTIYIGGLRKTGAEVFGSSIWWNELRPVHAMLYMLFAIYAFQNKSYSWVPLAIDVCVGLVAFLTYHYCSGNFPKLML